MIATGHEARSAAVVENLRRRNERVEVHRDYGQIDGLSADVESLKRILGDLPKALTTLAERIAELESAAAVTADLSSGVLRLTTDMQNLNGRLRKIETGWLPFEETMRQHANRSA